MSLSTQLSFGTSAPDFTKQTEVLLSVLTSDLASTVSNPTGQTLLKNKFILNNFLKIIPNKLCHVKIGICLNIIIFRIKDHPLTGDILGFITRHFLKEI